MKRVLNIVMNIVIYSFVLQGKQVASSGIKQAVEEGIEYDNKRTFNSVVGYH